MIKKQSFWRRAHRVTAISAKTAISAAIGTIMLCGTAHASATASATFPPRKPGLWETSMIMKMTMVMNGKTMTDNGSTPTISALCVDAATDAMEMKKMAGSNCGQLDIEKTGGVYTISGSCADPLGSAGAVVTFNGTITPQGDEAFHMVSQSSGPGMSSSMVADSKWTGACPAGVQPGDFGTIQNGAFVKRGNVLQTRPAQ